MQYFGTVVVVSHLPLVFTRHKHMCYSLNPSQFCYVHHTASQPTGNMWENGVLPAQFQLPYASGTFLKCATHRIMSIVQNGRDCLGWNQGVKTQLTAIRSSFWRNLQAVKDIFRRWVEFLVFGFQARVPCTAVEHRMNLKMVWYTSRGDSY